MTAEDKPPRVQVTFPAPPDVAEALEDPEIRRGLFAFIRSLVRRSGTERKAMLKP